MNVKSTRKVITVDEKEIHLSRDELAAMLEEEFSTEDEPLLISPRAVKIEVTVGKQKVTMGQILELVRGRNAEVPEDAEVVLAVRWQREVEGAQQTVIQPTGNFVPNVVPAAGGAGVTCPSCGTIPEVEGPTPDCFDPQGCGFIRRTKGEIIPAKAVAEGEAPIIGSGGPGAGVPPGAPSRLPPNVAVNRETGERAFMSRDGSLYGKHEDYQR